MEHSSNAVKCSFWYMNEWRSCLPLPFSTDSSSPCAWRPLRQKRCWFGWWSKNKYDIVRNDMELAEVGAQLVLELVDKQLFESLCFGLYSIVRIYIRSAAIIHPEHGHAFFIELPVTLLYDSAALLRSRNSAHQRHFHHLICRRFRKRE